MYWLHRGTFHVSEQKPCAADDVYIEKTFRKVSGKIETMSPFVVKHIKEKSIEEAVRNLHGVLKMEKNYRDLFLPLLIKGRSVS